MMTARSRRALRPTTAAALCILLMATAGSADATVVKRWGLFEKTLQSTTSRTEIEKYRNVTLEATFRGPNNIEMTVPGFWDGGTTWRIRFSPPTTGQWSYTIASNDSQLDAPANDGAFNVTAPAQEEIDANPNWRGFIRKDSRNRTLTYADGTPFFWMADTLWDGNSRNMPFETDFKTYVANRRRKGFTAIQILVAEPDPLQGLDGRYTGYNQNGPIFHQKWNRINPANLQEFDRRIKEIVFSGMVPVIFFNWGAAYNVMSTEDVKAYHGYLVARYQAWNVIWCISGEYETANNQFAKIRAAGQHVRQIDGHRHLIAIHPGPNTSSSGFCSSQHFRNEGWLDFHMQQTWRQAEEYDWMSRAYRLNDGPVVSAEAGYDGMWSHDRTRVRKEAWKVYMGGGAGYTYGVNGIAFAWNVSRALGLTIPPWQNVIDAPSSVDMQRIVTFFRSVPWWTMSPRADLVNAGYCLADPGKHYLVYLEAGGSTTIKNLAAPYEARWFNPSSGAYQTASGPTFRAPSSADWVLHVRTTAADEPPAEEPPSGSNPPPSDPPPVNPPEDPPPPSTEPDDPGAPGSPATPPPPQPGDRRTNIFSWDDLAVVDPATWMWYVLDGSGSSKAFQFGMTGSMPAAADYDGDEILDSAVYVGGEWYIHESTTDSLRRQSWGWNETIPVPADYTGDGLADLAVYHPGEGNWYILGANNEWRRQNWGWSETIPVPSDYDGDGRADLAVYHIATGDWYILESSTGNGVKRNWGWIETTPVPGDYDGDGKGDLAVYHAATGDWYILHSSDNSARKTNWGWNATVPVPGDYDRDGRTDLAVYHSATGDWYVLQSRDNHVKSGGALNWGWSAALPAHTQLWLNKSFGR